MQTIAPPYPGARDHFEVFRDARRRFIVNVYGLPREIEARNTARAFRARIPGVDAPLYALLRKEAAHNWLVDSALRRFRDEQHPNPSTLTARHGRLLCRFRDAYFADQRDAIRTMEQTLLQQLSAIATGADTHAFGFDAELRYRAFFAVQHLRARSLLPAGCHVVRFLPATQLTIVRSDPIFSPLLDGDRSSGDGGGDSATPEDLWLRTERLSELPSGAVGRVFDRTEFGERCVEYLVLRGRFTNVDPVTATEVPHMDHASLEPENAGEMIRRAHLLRPWRLSEAMAYYMAMEALRVSRRTVLADPDASPDVVRHLLECALRASLILARGTASSVKKSLEVLEDNICRLADVAQVSYAAQREFLASLDISALLPQAALARARRSAHQDFAARLDECRFSQRYLKSSPQAVAESLIAALVARFASERHFEATLPQALVEYVQKYPRPCFTPA